MLKLSKTYYTLDGTWVPLVIDPGKVLARNQDDIEVWMDRFIFEAMVFDVVHAPKPGSCPPPDPWRLDYEATIHGHDPERDPVGYGSSPERAAIELRTMLEERGGA